MKNSPGPPEPPEQRASSDESGTSEPSDRAGTGSGKDGGGGPARPRIEIDRSPVGIFPSWTWLYGTVVAWSLFLILLLYAFTVMFDYGAR